MLLFLQYLSLFVLCLMTLCGLFAGPLQIRRREAAETRRRKLANVAVSKVVVTQRQPSKLVPNRQETDVVNQELDSGSSPHSEDGLDGAEISREKYISSHMGKDEAASAEDEVV